MEVVDKNEILSRDFSDYRRGFGLMIGFIGFLDTAHDCTLQFTITYTHTHTSVHSHVFTAVTWYRLPTVDVPFLWVPELSPYLS
jgi:hypothetical protein